MQSREDIVPVYAALIRAPDRPHEEIFGRPLLERLLLVCARAGVTRFFIEAPEPRWAEMRAALGSFRDSSDVRLVVSLRDALAQEPRDARGIELRGSLVLSPRQLRELITAQAARLGEVAVWQSTDDGRESLIGVGPVHRLLEGDYQCALRVEPTGPLWFALTGSHGGARETELWLARELRHESAERDAPMARWLDRRLSWRISYRLAHTAITPNQVTLTSTALGLLGAALLAWPGYWPRLAGAVTFLVSTTLDGVDGELARLKLAESRLGARLDTLTDNLVHVALFAAIMIGCHRASGGRSYLALLVILFGGFGVCAVAGWRARQRSQDQQWIAKLERLTGRDFAYLLVVLALVGRIHFFAWGAAVGSYIFAIALWWSTPKQVAASESSGGPIGTENRGLLVELAALWGAVAGRREPRHVAAAGRARRGQA